MLHFFKRIGLDGFVLAIILVIIGAFFYPEIGITREPVSLGDIASFGVSLIFFFYGLRLNSEKLKEGLKNIKLHFLIHISTFILFPVIVLVGMNFVSVSPESFRYYLLLGIFFLATLPSTVSSSVVMVSIAGGNVPAAIFNASVSSLLGIFITPLWMSLFVNTSTGAYPISDIIFKLLLQVLLPVILGFMLNKKFGKYAEKYKTNLRKFDQTVILLIIYTSFCQSFYERMFDGFSAKALILLAAVMTAFFILVYLIIFAFAKLFKFNNADTITALFCGSKKSLVHGSVMSKVIFVNPAVAGIVLLPTMIYHAMQLIIVSAIARSSKL